MKENMPDSEIVVIINRKTGEFRLFGSFYILDFRLNKVFKIENDRLIPLCTGYLNNNIWRFEGMGIVKEHVDPYAAVIALLSEIL